MRYLIAFLLCLLSASVAAMGVVYTPDRCAGAPPALTAGTSADGPVCLGQSVRDRDGRVWTYVAIPGDPRFGTLTTTGVPAHKSSAVRVKAGRVEAVYAGTQWAYWLASVQLWWDVNAALPAPPQPTPPGSG